MKGLIKYNRLIRSAGVIIDSDIDGDQLLRYGGPENGLYVYRITRTNEDGVSVDLSWEQVKQRCEVLGVNHVPELHKDIVKSKEHKEEISEYIESATHSDSVNFPQHLREGVVVRIEHGGFTPTFLKHKNYYFRILDNSLPTTTIEDEN